MQVHRSSAESTTPPNVETTAPKPKIGRLILDGLKSIGKAIAWLISGGTLFKEWYARCSQSAPKLPTRALATRTAATVTSEDKIARKALHKLLGKKELTEEEATCFIKKWGTPAAWTEGNPDLAKLNKLSLKELTTLRYSAEWALQNNPSVKKEELAVFLVAMDARIFARELKENRASFYRHFASLWTRINACIGNVDEDTQALFKGSIIDNEMVQSLAVLAKMRTLDPEVAKWVDHPESSPDKVDILKQLDPSDEKAEERIKFLREKLTEAVVSGYCSYNEANRLLKAILQDPKQPPLLPPRPNKKPKGPITNPTV